LKKTDIDINKILELNSLGYSGNQIVQATGVQSQWVSSILKEYGRRNVFNSKSIENISYEEEQVLIGHVLGDGCLYRHHFGENSGTSIKIKQGFCQKEYAEWKYNKMKRFFRQPLKVYKNNGFEGGHEEVSVIGRKYCILNKYYDWFYTRTPKKKYIHPHIINIIDPLGLAVWYMDDGSRNASAYFIYTNCFSISDLQMTKKILYERFNIVIGIGAKNIIHISGDSRLIFHNLIKPYIIPSMEYKLLPESKFSRKKRVSISEKDVLNIYDSSLSYEEIIQNYNITRAVFRNIKNRKAWIKLLERERPLT